MRIMKLVARERFVYRKTGPRYWTLSFSPIQAFNDLEYARTRNLCLV